MRKSFVLRWSVLIACLVSGCVGPSKQAPITRYKIYYIPRYLELYRPVREGEFEVRSDYTLSSNSSVFESLFDVKKLTYIEPELHQSAYLRIEVIDLQTKQISYVERDGRLLLSGLRYKMADSQLRLILTEILDQAEKVPSKRVPLDRELELNFK